jgi:transposase
MGRKGKELCPEEKRIVINIFESGNTITDISILSDRPHSTVSSFIRRYLLRGELKNRRRSGRPKKITPRDYRKLERLVKVNRRDTLSKITIKFNENNANPVAKRTLQYHLHENGFKRQVQREKNGDKRNK